MPKMTKSQFEEMFREELLPKLIEHEQRRGSGFPDKPGRREAWNNTVDSYMHDRQLPESAGNWTHPRWLETARGPARSTRHDHAVRAKKSPAQLDREIADVLSGARRHSHATNSARDTSVGAEGYSDPHNLAPRMDPHHDFGTSTTHEFSGGTVKPKTVKKPARPDWVYGGGARHARKKKITPQEARRLLESDGIDFGKDFFQLGSYDVGRIAEVAKLASYRKRKDAPGSAARMYFQYLSRQRGHASHASHATRDMLTVYDLIEVNKQTKQERVLHQHFSTRADAKEAQNEYEGYKRPGVSYRIKSRQVPRPPMRWNLED